MSEPYITVRYMLECHRDMMLEHAATSENEHVAKACRYLADRDSALLARLANGDDPFTGAEASARSH